jgi:type 2 lantibiotic biosynthesis protein LanM
MQISHSYNTINFQNTSLFFIEGVLLSCFEDFKKILPLNNFEYYKRELESTNLQFVFSKYPVAESLFEKNGQKIDNLLSIISEKFNQDALVLHLSLSLNLSSSKIDNIQIGVGDFHKGVSTAIIDLVNHQKIVFKPTGANISEAFFDFLDWVNQYYPLGEYRYQVINGNNYHWLEFVNHIPCQTADDLKLYYERAGFLLGVLYLFNATDFHYENIIAKGTTPVIIDHETIIQPKINSNYLNLFKSFTSKDIEDSVILTMLLPNHDESVTTMPIGTCGFGYHKQKSMQTLKKEAVDRYTDNWRFVTKFADESFQKQNIPTLNNQAIYPVEYLEEFLIGFDKCYQLFLNHRKFLLEDEYSPLRAFSNNTIRYIWRATSIYGKILNHMKLPKNLVSFVHYEQKIHDYLAVAFKNVPKDSDLWLIHKHEVAQMFRGDVPFFEVNSSSRDLETEFGTIKDFFELSAVENIQRKLKKLSFEDLETQKDLIKKSLLS